MDFLRPNVTLLFTLVMLLSSCAKVGYIVGQGTGQLALQTKARPNAEVLKDPRVAATNKRKIEIVTEAKAYFYRYFSKTPTKIYDKTTMLEREMVTTLVIASPFDKIEAREECFPFVGCFPYLGFFDPEDAQEYAADLEDQGLVTYSRPVYAYSTLGHFDDTILSSFFHYEEEELVELVFHELFHTIFFVADEVELNENLANYFGMQMKMEYFKWTPEKAQLEAERLDRQTRLALLIVDQAQQLSKRYETQKLTTKAAHEALLQQFLADSFKPAVTAFCTEEKLTDKSCWPLDREWNNASFAAFLTYEKKAQRISDLHRELNLDLLGLYSLLEKSYDCYDKLQGKIKESLTYEQFLFEQRSKRLCLDI